MHSPAGVFRQNDVLGRLLVALLLSYNCNKNDFCSSLPAETPTASPNSNLSILSSLQALKLDGQIFFDNIDYASKDFGDRYHFLPAAVLHPKTVQDISSIIKHIYSLGTTSALTVAARGHGHSLEGQSQAHNGLVINMESFREQDMHFHTGELPYVDVSGGELWINILQEGLKHGLAPKSWTDYLHLTVGGTLSNAGISGQAFRHGPQIDNVYQLEVVTGTLQKLIIQYIFPNTLTVTLYLNFELSKTNIIVSYVIKCTLYSNRNRRNSNMYKQAEC